MLLKDLENGSLIIIEVFISVYSFSNSRLFKIISFLLPLNFEFKLNELSIEPEIKFEEIILKIIKFSSEI